MADYFNMCYVHVDSEGCPMASENCNRDVNLT